MRPDDLFEWEVDRILFTPGQDANTVTATAANATTAATPTLDQMMEAIKKLPPPPPPPDPNVCANCHGNTYGIGKPVHLGPGPFGLLVGYVCPYCAMLWRLVAEK